MLSERTYWTTLANSPFERPLVPLIRDAFERGYRVFLDGESLVGFGISSGFGREVNFSYRGRIRSEVEGMLLEVVLADSNTTYRLGPYFGLKESACIVVKGVGQAMRVCHSWLDGSPVEAAIDGAEFWERSSLSLLKRSKLV